MAGEAAAAMLQIQAIQMLFNQLESGLHLGSFLCPQSTPIETITSKGADIIIIGAGTAGSVLANRLSSCPNLTVLLIETGGCPPIESLFLGLFPTLPNSIYDYNMTGDNDHYSHQNLQGGVADLTAGRMLGGSSSLHHAIHVLGDRPSINKMAEAANDTSWTRKNLLRYYKKSEKILDKDIYNKYPTYHGRCGPTKVKRQPSALTDGMIQAFAELGYAIRIDTNNDNPAGAVEPLFEVDYTFRQSGLVSYISTAKDRENLRVMTGATATKIIFNDKKVATGVQISYNGSSYIVKCNKEVVVAAGALKTPQLLMLSGIGPEAQLKQFNLPTISNLPVGDNLHDHVSACALYTFQCNASSTAGSNFLQFPVPVVCNYINLDNRSADSIQYQGINLLFPPSSSGLLQLCLKVFKYKESICQKWYDASKDKCSYYVVAGNQIPYSKGSLRLQSNDITVQPRINPGYLSDKRDVVNLGKFLNHMNSLFDTSSFKKVGAEFVDLGLCNQYKKFSVEYWECYGVAMSSTLWHYCGTASLGSVVDAKARVKGVSGLRAVDASIMPYPPTGNINAAVLAIAEKIADDIRATYKYFCCNKAKADKNINYKY